MKKLTAAEKVAAYERLLRKRREYYRKHAEERKLYARKRYREMMDALNEKKRKG
jgi:hypothetical protein